MTLDLFEEIARLRRERRAAALATIVATKGSTPGRLGQRMVVLGNGRILGTVGGGCVEADVIRGALDVIDTGIIRQMSFELNGVEAERTGLACGGTLTVMIEPLQDPHLIVLGGGHVGRKIAELAKKVGFRLTVMDDRPDFANDERFPYADDVICEDFSSLGDVIHAGPESYVVVVTRGHAYDYDGMRWALTTPARFIGVIGSRSKRTQFMRRLREEGVADQELRRVHCPVGLDIGAATPDEIAVSVVGALIAKRRLNR